MGWLMLALALIELESFLNYSGFIIYTPWLINISPPLILLLGPLTFLHITTNARPNDSQKLWFLHFSPALLYFFYSGFFFLQPTAFKLNAVLRSFHGELVNEYVPPGFPVDPLEIQGIVVIEGLAVHLLIYVLISAVVLWRTKPFEQGRVLKTKSQHHQWMVLLVAGLLIGSFVFLLTGGVVNGYTLFKSVLPAYAVNLYCVVFTYLATGFWVSVALSSRFKLNKYAKSSLSTELQLHKLSSIRQIMDTQKPFKDSEFSLDHLSKLASMSPHHTSQVINGCMGMTFTEFVNWYRVQEARSVLDSASRNEVKVEMLAYELGYKSKSAFFNAFKRYTDTTPSRYRELMR